MSTTPDNPTPSSSLAPGEAVSTWPWSKGPPWLGPTHDRRAIDQSWLLIAGTLTVASLVFFGWRAVASIAVSAIATLVTYLLLGLVMHLLRPKRPADSVLHPLMLGMMLGCALPLYHKFDVHLLGGLLLGLLAHVVGRTHRLRLHAVALTIVIVWLLPAITVKWQMMYLARLTNPPVESVLRPQHLVLGDVQDTTEQVSFESWWSTRQNQDTDAVRRHDAYAVLVRDQAKILQHEPLLVNMLSSGELPRLEELMIGATPGAAGASSRAIVVLLGLYLMYRRLSSWQIPVAAVAAVLLTLTVMPLRLPDGDTVPVLVRLLQLDPAIVVTYLGYFLLASPLLFIAMILAPITAPMSVSGRWFYGLILGCTMLLAQWFLGLPDAAYLSLVLASAVSRPLDALQRSEWVR